MNGPANQSSSGFSFNGPTIISLLYLAGFLGVGLTGLVGLILCYIWRGEARPAWEINHFTFHIRTFWIALIAGIIGFILSFILIGIPMLIALAVWVAVRSVIALLKAQRQEPFANPQTWLV